MPIFACIIRYVVSDTVEKYGFFKWIRSAIFGKFSNEERIAP